MDWSSPAVQSDTDSELFWKITNGGGPCPRGSLRETERWQIVNYIRTPAFPRGSQTFRWIPSSATELPRSLVPGDDVVTT